MPPQRAFSADTSRWFKKWKRRDHSDDPQVVFSAALDKDNALDRGNSNDQDKGSDPGRDNFNALVKVHGPGGWTERVVADRA